MIKPCRKCGSIERYTSGDCAPCARAITARYRAKNLEKVRASDAARGAKPDRKAYNKSYFAAYSVTPKAMIADAARRAKPEFKKANAARSAKRYATPEGKAYAVIYGAAYRPSYMVNNFEYYRHYSIQRKNKKRTELQLSEYRAQANEMITKHQKEDKPCKPKSSRST